MQARLLAVVTLVSMLGATSLSAQGSGTTHPTTTTTKKTSSKSYQVTKSVSGKVVSNQSGAITLKVGSKTRRFVKTSGTKNASAEFSTGQQVKVFYRSASPGTATEIR
ncbi:MAG TPA: hypothetical protein VNM92_04065 [Thermoanaerobaculia bacterium]|nr:hypothetical protein [Thermoanaerobaculia bacterium]